MATGSQASQNQIGTRALLFSRKHSTPLYAKHPDSFPLVPRVSLLPPRAFAAERKAAIKARGIGQPLAHRAARNGAYTSQTCARNRRRGRHPGNLPARSSQVIYTPEQALVIYGPPQYWRSVDGQSRTNPLELPSYGACGAACPGPVFRLKTPVSRCCCFRAKPSIFRKKTRAFRKVALISLIWRKYR